MAQPAADSNVDPQVARALYIKTGVVSRLYKEEQTYRVESAEAKQNVEKLKKAKADGADIRNAVSSLHVSLLVSCLSHDIAAPANTPLDREQRPKRTADRPVGGGGGGRAERQCISGGGTPTCLGVEAVQKDCEQMVPLTVKKLQAAYEDLVHLMNGLEKDPIAETQQWADAKNVLQIVMNHWQSIGGP
ncbi:Tubulin-specific chaperone A [Trichosporon asahii var. asahii CBS 8904]|uniref:Tubulin-specific chaperone A n=2 Tax=Trichosporon asahii var. asahii TaxID=189963 RepID=K1VBQ9_TRIAC|nr:Tubulin-specific chaperone A [Trichosporon asahii var. asahii CBS 2479]EJT49570.1 Tubulin-specific chaperone A [Trichosporon asahii var. asahii CBS 2479]EKC98225.1 Tubulin-specific chaperone A [Trichosporon asahii var. asahii CBS 8904]